MTNGTDDEASGEVPSSGAHLLGTVAVARLESRVRALEDALERSVSRQQELERRHASEAELLRARLDDTLDVMTDTLQRSRAVAADAQQRVQHQVTASERSVRNAVDDLRDELVPRVSRGQAQIETVQHRLEGELEAFAEEIFSRLAQLDDELRHAANREERAQTLLDDQVDELRAFAIRRLVEAGQGVAEQREVLMSLADELGGRLSAVEHALEAPPGASEERVDQVVERLDGLETSVLTRAEAARAVLAERVDADLAATRQRLDDQQGHVDERLAMLRRDVDAQREQLTERLEARLDEAEHEQRDRAASLGDDLDGRIGALEQRVASAADEVRVRVEAVAASTDELLGAERDARRELEQQVEERAGELVAATAEVRELVGVSEVRVRERVAELAGDVETLRSTVAGLEEQVAAAVGSVASRLSNEVATIGGDLDAMRDVVREVETRAAAVDRHRRRLDLLDEQVAETGRRLRTINQAVLTAVQRHRERTEEEFAAAVGAPPVDDAEPLDADVDDSDDTDQRSGPG